MTFQVAVVGRLLFNQLDLIEVESILGTEVKALGLQGVYFSTASSMK
jgi:hypothetical protein